MNSIPIYSFVAFSGSGKTTLLEKLIAEMKARGMRVATVKHDAHGFDIDREGKDSWRFALAGADVTALVSGDKAAIMEYRPVTIEALLGKITDVDIIFIEGYKYGAWPKIAVHRSLSGNPPPVPFDECFAVVTDAPGTSDTPCFGLDDVRGLADLMLMRSADRKESEVRSQNSE